MAGAEVVDGADVGVESLLGGLVPDVEGVLLGGGLAEAGLVRGGGVRLQVDVDGEQDALESNNYLLQISSLSKCHIPLAWPRRSSSS